MEENSFKQLFICFFCKHISHIFPKCDNWERLWQQHIQLVTMATAWVQPLLSVPQSPERKSSFLEKQLIPTWRGTRNVPDHSWNYSLYMKTQQYDPSWETSKKIQAPSFRWAWLQQLWSLGEQTNEWKIFPSLLLSVHLAFQHK